jgi:RNA-binding protein
VSDAVEKAVDEALSHHELIKIKFYELKDERREACEHLAAQLGAVMVTVIGNIGVLYRPAKDPASRTYHLPKGKAAAPAAD